MTTETTDIQRLVADGKEIILADGSAATVHLNARAMAKIEDRYESLDAYFAALRAATGGKLYHHLAFTFQVVLGLPESKVWDLIDTRQTASYIKAIGAAIAEALPEASEEEKAEQAAAEQEGESGNPSTAPDRSPGAVSSTPPLSNGTSTPSGSGA